MFKYVIFSNTNFVHTAVDRSHLKRSQAHQGEAVPSSTLSTAAGAKPSLGNPDTTPLTHPNTKRHSLCSCPCSSCPKAAALLSAGTEPCVNRVQRKGHSHSGFLSSKRKATYWCLLGYWFSIANPWRSLCRLGVPSAPHNQDYREKHAHSKPWENFSFLHPMIFNANHLLAAVITMPLNTIHQAYSPNICLSEKGFRGTLLS